MINEILGMSKELDIQELNILIGLFRMKIKVLRTVKE
jgi:hypothetical protein